MPRFKYKAADADGEVLEGEYEATDQNAVVRWLQGQGHTPIRAVKIPERASKNRDWAWSRRITGSDIDTLTAELAILLRARVALDKALNILVGLTEKPSVRELLEAIRADVRGGASLSDALERHQKHLSTFYINMVRAGEAVGAVDQALERISEHTTRARELRESIQSALLYPTILAVVAIMSLSVIVGFVVPRFAALLEEANRELPLSAVVLVKTGQAVENHWWLIALMIFLVWIFVRRQLANPRFRLRWDRWLMNLPLLGQLIAKIETARFCQTLGTLLANGILLQSAIAMSTGTVGNLAMAGAMVRIIHGVQAGLGLAKPLRESGLFPPLAHEMISVGEESGELEEMLHRLTVIYDHEVQRTLRRVLALVEPVMIIGLALVIAGIIMSVLAAILQHQ